MSNNSTQELFEDQLTSFLRKKFLEKNDNWRYSFEPIVIDNGGITANSIRLASLYLSNNWCLVIQVVDDINQAFSIYDEQVEIENIENHESYYLLITRLPIKDLEVKIVNKNDILSRIQKRTTSIQLTTQNHQFRIIGLKNDRFNKYPIHNKETTEEIFKSLQFITKSE